MKTAPFALGLALTLAALPGVASADNRNDTWITLKTKIALLSAADVDGTDINVDTVRGTVTLHGTADSQAEIDKALRIARGIEGVHDVRSLLVVAPDRTHAGSADKGTRPKNETGHADDAEIKKAVKAALDADRSLADSQIHVETVKDGVVVLGGKSSSWTDHRRALQDARTVQGVVRVESKVESPAELAESEYWRETKTTASETKAKVETKAHETKEKVVAKTADVKANVADETADAWVTTAVKLRLLANEQTPGTEINVDTNNGVVTLFGMVPTEQAKTAAVAEARKVEDVKDVVNALQVVPKKEQEAVKAKDEDIERAVEKALAADPSLQNAKVDVEVVGGVVRLTGTVAEPSDRFDAALTARTVAGVRAVRQELEVKQSEKAKY